MPSIRSVIQRRRPVKPVWFCISVFACACLVGAPAQQGSAGTDRNGKAAGSAIRSIGQPPNAGQIILLAEARPPGGGPGAISASSIAATNPAPTYLRDVLPILMRRCSRCHNEQARFVYNWLDYRTAYEDRGEIERRVWDSWKGRYFKESMPIANSPESLSITSGERATIRKWVTEGAPRGVAPPPTIPRSKAEKIEMGRRLFASICAACHQPTGRGVPNVFPPLAGSDFLNGDKNRAIKVVLNGRQGEIVVNGQRFNNSMPKFPLTDQDIANVLTFVYNSFGNSGIEVTPEEVATLRKQPPDVTPPSTPPPKSEFE